MSDLDALIKAVDALPPEDFHKLFEHMKERRTMKVWVVPEENLARLEEIVRPLQEDAAQWSEEENNAVIDQAIAEVRRERKARLASGKTDF